MHRLKAGHQVAGVGLWATWLRLQLYSLSQLMTGFWVCVCVTGLCDMHAQIRQMPNPCTSHSVVSAILSKPTQMSPFSRQVPVPTTSLPDHLQHQQLYLLYPNLSQCRQIADAPSFAIHNSPGAMSRVGVMGGVTGLRARGFSRQPSRSFVTQGTSVACLTPGTTALPHHIAASSLPTLITAAPRSHMTCTLTTHLPTVLPAQGHTLPLTASLSTLLRG